MAIALTMVGCDVTLSKTRLMVKLALSGNYPAGGDTIDFTPLLGQGDQMQIFIANNPALQGDVSTSAGTGTGWIGSFIPGTTIQNGKIKWIVTSTGAEHATGAYTSQLAADPNINGEFVFEKLL